MEEITKNQAIGIALCGVFDRMNTNERVYVQAMYKKFMYRDFSKYHADIEEVLNRSVWTHEFASDELEKEIVRATGINCDPLDILKTYLGEFEYTCIFELLV